MNRLGQSRRLVRMRDNSPLRRYDPRAKMALVVLLALGLMLPLGYLLIYGALLVIFLTVTRLNGECGRQIWRMAWLLVILQVVDWIVFDVQFASLITLRMALVMVISTIVLATTTPEEVRLALLSLGMPYRYAFALGVSVQAVPMLHREWLAIMEAQKARGVRLDEEKKGDVRGWQRLWLSQRMTDWMALAIPAIVLATKRAWLLTEAAHSRGLGYASPTRYRELRMTWRDWVLIAGTALIIGVLIALGTPSILEVR